MTESPFHKINTTRRVEYKGGLYSDAKLYNRSVPTPDAVYHLTPPLVFDIPSSLYRIEINQNEDFDMSLQLMMLEVDGDEVPLDLTRGGAVTANLDMVIRPIYDHTTVIKRLTTPAGGGSGINVSDATLGMIQFYMTQADVKASLPITQEPVHGWEYFVNWQWAASNIVELFRGPFVVHAGRYPGV